MNNDKEKGKLDIKEYNKTVEYSKKNASSTEIIVDENDINTKANNLIEQALNLIETKAFDEAIHLMQRAIGFYNQINKKENVEAIRKKISEIYILKEQLVGDFEDKNHKQQSLIKPHEPTQDVGKFPEKDLSEEGIKAIREAKILIEIEEFDDALAKYDEAIEIYTRINDETKIQQIYELIDKCYDSKSEFLKKPKFIVPQKEIIIEEAALQRKELEDLEKLKRIEEVERKREEQENFEKKINTMVDQANKLERDYESEKKKAIKEGTFLNTQAPYKQMINSYHEIQKLLVDRGWEEAANQYNDQIKFCKEKSENDQKLREIEIQKIQKQKEYDALLKFKKNEEQTAEAQKMKAAQQKYQKDLEDDYFQKQITEVINNAERAAYEYEKKRTKAIKKGTLDFESIYPNLINIYNQIIDKLKKRGWIEQTKIYSNEIAILMEKQKNDERLREIEAQKIMKQREYEQFIKASNNKAQPKINLKNFENQIYDMIDQAIQKERNYEIAIRRGKIEDPPYGEIIEIYTNVKDMLVKMGKSEEAKIYDEQIDLAKMKFQKSKTK